MKSFFTSFMLILMVAVFAACSSVVNEVPETSDEKVDFSGVRIVDNTFNSEYPFEIIKYTPESRHYYVQQAEGEVTLESATSIVRELYSKEAFAVDGGTLGNVVIYDNTVDLIKNESPAFEIEEKAEYDSRTSVIHFNGETASFEPAYK